MFDLANGCNSCEAFPSGDNFMNSNELGPMNSNVSAMNTQQNNNNNNVNNNVNNSSSLNNRVNNSNNLRQVMTEPAPQVNNPNNANNANNANNSSNVPQQQNKPNRKHVNMCIQLGLIVLAALAVNEAAKYYIEQQMKFNEGNTMYYGGYAAVAVLLAIVVRRFLN